MTRAVECTLEVAYGDAATARAVRDALAPDDAGYVRSRAEGPRVIAEMGGKKPRQLLHTVEDYLACLAVAERAAHAAKG
ncbi:MAG: KEOPS complex subunit Pcc1 [Candidatus Thermoplasmatota archaeon]